ncbi:RusA family crossover junction endodeoxyribonuclease [uncultured Clostridium sp.]|uniref:RusA family crossover junction endodeoxyribonuclease n=1 Tax=uncultured Clostridium sp. TaxID=59620 RepID=UPI0026340B2F|nr:RusA family crossover junction endodeoxyribonuclease [uncultured Clostridium sp.]
MSYYAKVIVNGSPITKSNFKLHNKDGRAILPSNTGQYHDRYALYEQEIAYIARLQNPKIVLEEGLIAILKVYYKSEKRHPDTINISKSIFDGIEKSGLIINDAQIQKIFIEEYYDKENPRFELELFSINSYDIDYSITKRSEKLIGKKYEPIKNTKTLKNNISPKKIEEPKDNCCEICNKKIKNNDFLKANGGKTLICRSCFSTLF